LMEEEKKQKLEELRQKMTEKRAKRAVEEAQENKVNEALRRKAGKVRVACLLNYSSLILEKDMNKIKEDMRLKEALKEAEVNKRGIYTCVGDLPDDLLIPPLEKI